MKTCVKGKPIQMVLPRCTKVFPFLSQFFCRAFPNIFPICCRCLAACHARCCNMLCTRQLSETKKLPCNTSRIDWQEHGNRLMEPWLVNCKRNNSGTAKKSVRKTIERRTTSLTVATDLPMCRFFLIYIPCLSHQTYALVEAFFLSCRQQPTNLSADMAGRALCFKYLHIVI